MENKVYQACYTRVGASCIGDVVSDQPVTEGYQNIHCSSDIPGKAREVFEERRKTVSSTSAAYLKMQGLSLFCDKNVYGAEFLQYDLQTEDRSGGGRPCFFDQTFLIEDAYEHLKTPEELIYISEDNFGIDFQNASEQDKEEFAASIEGRLRWCIRNTAVIPRTLKFDHPGRISAEAICKKYNISKENADTYIMAAYHQLFSREAQTSIFVKTDGSISMMKDMLYLFMSMIPYSARVQISGGEYCYEDQKGNNIYFTDRIPSNGMFVDPLTGEENVLKNMSMDRFEERYPYITCVLSLDPADRTRYFDTLEKGMESLGITSANNWQRQHLTLIHLMITGREDPDNLIPILYGLLKYPVSHNEVWEKSISDAVQTVILNKVKLSEEMENMLMNTVSSSGDSISNEAVLDYEASLLEKREVSEACEALKAMSEDRDKYERVTRKLLKTGSGQALMHEYYLREFNALKEGTGDADLIAMANTVRGIRQNADLLDILAEQALIHSMKELDSNKRPYGEISRELEQTIRGIYKDRGEQSAPAVKKLRDRYYHALMSDISGDSLRSGEFIDFFKTYGREYPDGVRFLKALNALNAGKLDKVKLYIESDLPDEYADRICSFLVSRLRKYEKDHNDYIRLSLWLDFAGKMRAVPANLMIDNRAMLLFDPYILDTDLDEEEKLWSDNLLRQTIEIVKARMKEDPKYKKQLKESLEILKTEADLRRKGEGGLFSKLFGR